MNVYARFLRDRERYDEAADLDKRAAEVRKSGAKPAPALPDGVSRIKDGVAAPSPDYRPEPSYSIEARMAGLQGTVVAWVVIGTDGLIHDVQILHPLGLGLDEQAVEAINQWRFKPGTKNGTPVKVAATIEVNFRLL